VVYSLFWAEILENRFGSLPFPGKHITALYHNLHMASTNYACALFRNPKKYITLVMQETSMVCHKWALATMRDISM
jgi:hypothetical protein